MAISTYINYHMCLYKNMDDSKTRGRKPLIYNPGQQILFDPVPGIFFLTLQCTNKNNFHGDIETHKQETICHEMSLL